MFSLCSLDAAGLVDGEDAAADPPPTPKEDGDLVDRPETPVYFPADPAARATARPSTHTM